MIDIHCHVLPGVDDGAANTSETEAALRSMHEQGLRGLVVTPHVDASALLRAADVDRIASALDRAWASLVDLGTARFPDIQLHRGTELMLDLPSPDLGQEWLRLGGTRSVLVEFLGMMIPPRATNVIEDLTGAGFIPVIAHPERYRNLSSDCRELEGWRDLGARLQVNCGSLLGGYGPDAYRRAWKLLELGNADYLASDFHARGEYPVLACRRTLEQEDALEQFELLFSTNPARLLDGLEPLPVPPTAPRLSPWKKLVKRGRFWWSDRIRGGERTSSA